MWAFRSLDQKKLATQESELCMFALRLTVVAAFEWLWSMLRHLRGRRLGCPVTGPWHGKGVLVLAWKHIMMRGRHKCTYLHCDVSFLKPWSETASYPRIWAFACLPCGLQYWLLLSDCDPCIDTCLVVNWDVLWQDLDMEKVFWCFLEHI